MNTNRTLAVVVGGLMVGVGGLALMANLLLGALGVWQPHDILRVWPLTVAGIGLGLCAVPLAVRGTRWLGMFFVPGATILYTGAILSFTSMTGWWDAWSWLWPQEILGLAVGFLAALVYTRSVWLGVPVILLGINGLAFQLCAVTGWWSAWAVLWTIEPLAIGLCLLLIGARTHSRAVNRVGLALCAFAVAASVGMLVILARVWWVASAFFSVLLILAGGGLLSLSLLRGRLPASTQSPEMR